MNTNTIETAETPETRAPHHAEGERPTAKKAARKKKAERTKNPAAKTKAERANKKAEVVALMKRAKGATLAEIVAATGWQKHTVRGLVSILGSNGGEKVESSKNEAMERIYRIAK